MSPTWAPCSVLKKYEFFRCRMAFLCADAEHETR